MTKSRYHSSELDQFVQDCDDLGGISHPNCRELLSNFSLEYETFVDQTIDPYSEEYVCQQISLYKELSGKELDQSTGEMTLVPDNSASANPYGSKDAKFILQNTHAVTTAMLVAGIKPGDNVLDLGCGWGLSTETIGFSGVHVHAVDINPDFISLVNERCSARNMDFTTSVSNFDTFESEKIFDIAFFYECLHHSVKPWDTLQHISKFLKQDAKIVFAGEPINDYWRTWGLRQDPLSIYCIRKFGWFESGWSKEFLMQCFSRVGWELKMHDGIGLHGGYIGCAVRQTQHHASIDAVPESIHSLTQHSKSENRSLTESDVIEAYRWILGREPESQDAIAIWLNLASNPVELRHGLLYSPEMKSSL